MMQSSFEKIVRTKPKRNDFESSKKDKRNAKVRKQRRQEKRDGGLS